MKTLSLKLPESLAAKLAAVAERAGRTKSEVVRDAIEAYLDGHTREGGRTLHAIARDLIGCLEGPSDLSHEPGHLERYGR